ncbi:MAG: DUF84 family protein [Acidobacteriota bacterium]
MDDKQFWRDLQKGLAVAVAGATPAHLLGVRDAVLRYLHHVVGLKTSVAVVPQPVDTGSRGLAVSEVEVVEALRSRLQEVELQVGEEYALLVAAEGGVHSLDLDLGPKSFVTSWAVVRTSFGEGLGSSGSIELPAEVMMRSGALGRGGTRRSGGMLSSLTGGQENRRRATATATFHALCALFYGTAGGPRSGP